MKIKQFSPSERPRERLILHGPSHLSNAELLAIIIGSGTKDENAIELSRKMIAASNIRRLSRKRISELKKFKGIGETKACRISAAFELSKRLSSFYEEKKQISCRDDIMDIAFADLSNQKEENLMLICLDRKNKLLSKEIISKGSLDAVIIHPREVFKIAMQESASAIILLHNHPSGDSTPSKADIEMTKEILNAGKLLGIDVIDHIIIGEKNYTSIAEEECKKKN